MNIFGSKIGHLNNNSKKCNVSFIFPKLLVYLMIFPSSAAYLALSTLKNHQILKTVLEKMKIIFPIILLLLKWPLLQPKMFTVKGQSIYILFINSSMMCKYVDFSLLKSLQFATLWNCTFLKTFENTVSLLDDYEIFFFSYILGES